MSSIRWWLAVDGKPTGPFTLDEVSQRLRNGSATPRDMACAEGKTEWQPLASIPELSAVLSPPPPPQTPPPPHTPPPPVGGPAQYGGHPQFPSPAYPPPAYGTPSYAPRRKSKLPMVLGLFVLFGAVIAAIAIFAQSGGLKSEIVGTWEGFEIDPQGRTRSSSEGFFRFEKKGKATYWRRKGSKPRNMRYEVKADPPRIRLWTGDKSDSSSLTLSLDRNEKNEKSFIVLDEDGRERDPLLLKRSSVNPDVKEK